MRDYIDAPGRGLLKVTSILYLIASALMLFLVILAATTDFVFFNLTGSALAVVFAFDFIWFLVKGVLGVKNCGNLNRAGMLRTFGIISTALVTLAAFITPLSFSTFTGFVLPVLYLIGAQKNVRAHKEEAAYALQSQMQNQAQAGTNQAAPQAQDAAPVIPPLVRRAFLLLEDGEWDKADTLLEQALNEDPENAYAYVAKLCIELRLQRPDALRDYEFPLDGYSNYRRAVQFADEKHRAVLEAYSLTPAQRAEEEVRGLMRAAEERRERAEREAREFAIRDLQSKLSAARAREDYETCWSLVEELNVLNGDPAANPANVITRVISAEYGSVRAVNHRISCPICGTVQASANDLCAKCDLEFVKIDLRK